MAHCVRLKPERRSQVCSYDLAEAQSQDGRKLRPMALSEELTREFLTIHVALEFEPRWAELESAVRPPDKPLDGIFCGFLVCPMRDG